jgi:hypothetical protein
MRERTGVEGEVLFQALRASHRLMIQRFRAIKATEAGRGSSAGQYVNAGRRQGFYTKMRSYR